MDFKEIKELIDLVNNSKIDYFEFSQDGAQIRMSKTAYNSKVEKEKVIIPQEDKVVKNEIKNDNSINSEDVGNKGVEIKSPMVGTFYSSPSPSKPSFVNIGSKVKIGDTLCILEAMKLMNEIESEVEGEIVEILVKDGEMVEYGQTLFIVKEV